MADIGLSFSPTANNSQYGNNNQTGGGNISPVQDAIRILSFRLPSVLGASAVSPLVGLGSQPLGGGAPVDSALMQEWLRRLLTGDAGGGFGGGGQAGTPPQGAPPSYPTGPSGGSSPVPPPSVIINQPRPQPPPMPPITGGGGGGRLGGENPFPGVGRPY